ncbi:MAG: hypothetical protein BGO41_15235 [Clostridiales bacterium 38-18]|nr:MAG: hypothetical protein BGO41_15235 [Clostridiales bacterium 38-18]
MIYGYLILVILMIIALSTILWSTHKNNKIYINILLIVTIIGNCFVYSGLANYQGSLNKNAYFLMNRFEDALLEFNQFNRTIDSMDAFGALVDEIRDLYKVTNYLEVNHQNLKLKNINVDDFDYILRSLNNWILDYLEIHDRLYKEDRSSAENYYESYNRMASLLVEFSSHLVVISSNYYDNFRVLTFELEFNVNSFDELSKIIQELNEVLGSFDSN